jgi:glycosyltransferase involved in cell wall biosynthesis
MKRILYIEANKDGTVGGSYYSLLYLLQGLDKNKYEPHVMFYQEHVLVQEFKKVTPHVYVNDLETTNDPSIRSIKDFIKWPYLLFAYIILKQRSLRKILNTIKPDLVHLNDSYDTMHEWMLACHLNKIKVVAHDRGTRYPCNIRTRMFVRYLDAIISVSDSYKNQVIKQDLKVKRIYRVYNGLDIDKMATEMTPDRRKKYFKDFELDEKQPVVGIIANIDRWKGQHVVLRSINEVRKSYPQIRCLIVGSVCKGAAGYKAELDKYVTDNNLGNNIFFTGFRRDVPNILNILDILLHGSVEPEPFGRVILEGMAAGKAIIATNAGGTPEQIIDGETGLLVSMDDHHEMAEAIKFILVDPKRAQKLGENAKNRLSEKFSIKKMVEETESIYSDIFSTDPITLNKLANT